MMRRLRRSRVATSVLVGVTALVVGAGGVYWFGLRDDAAAAQTPEVTSQAVAASLTTLEKSVTASGTLAPTVQEDVSFEAAGTVTSVDVVAGQTVTAGQTLATIDTLTLNADLLSAKATLATAKARLADSEDGDDGSDASAAQIAANAAQVEVAAAAVDVAAEAMADAVLVAPVDGLLTEVNLTVGQAVTGSGGSSAPGTGQTSADSTSSAQFVVVGTESWQIDVTVDDADVALIAVGDQAEITIEDVTDLVFGTVTEIGLISTSTSGVAAYPVSIEVTGQPDGVYDGVSGDVAIVYERRTDVLTVPSAAVRTVDGGSVVTQAGADGTEITTSVTVGETVGDLTEITAGLVEGDEVLVTVVTQSSQDAGTGTEVVPGQFPEGFDPSQMQLPDGFDPSQFGGGRANG
jgi:macrolide-specific efflux system membrane fusion protein